MPCVCAQCLRHCQTLSLDRGPKSRAVIHSAYRRAAKTWHPDRFERDPVQRQKAEELFKLIQVAYTELLNHLGTPIEWPASEEPFTPRNPTVPAPGISFGGAPGCFVAPNFPMQALEVIMQLGQEEQALALIDLAGGPSARLSRYMLLTTHGIFIHNPRNRVSLLWYKDLGEMRLADRFGGSRLAQLWQELTARALGDRPRLRLEIYGRDGGIFLAIASEADDNVKKVIYRFLQQKRTLMHR